MNLKLVKIISVTAVFLAIGSLFLFFSYDSALENSLFGGTARLQPSSTQVFLEKFPEAERKTRLLFFGDLMLDRHVGEQIKLKGLDHIFRDLASSSNPLVGHAGKGFFGSYDLVGCNLEGAVTDQGKHYPPDHIYDFAFHPDVIDELKKYGFNYFNLANNHFADQGERGIIETRKNLQRLGFFYSGCKDKETGDCSIAKIEINGKNIGLAGFSMVYGKFDLGEAERIVNELSASVDFTIVNIHWGREYVHNFDPLQQVTGRKLITAGADVIIGHHPHVIQGMEIYEGRPIFYSLGNFVFDQYFSKETQEGMAVSIEIGEDSVSYAPIFFRSEKSAIKKYDPEVNVSLTANFLSWSDLDDDRVEEIVSTGNLIFYK